MSIHRRPDGSQVNVGLLRHALLGGTSLVSTPAFSADFTILTSLPSWLSFSRASNAMVTDSTGNLTYAPNNILLHSDDLSNAAWTNDGTLSITSGVSDPDGGTNAQTLTTIATDAYVFQSYNAVAGLSGNWIPSVWIRRRTGTGTVHFKYPDNTDNTVTISSSWTRIYIKGSVTANNPGMVIEIVGAGSGADAIDVYHPQLEQVTYETTPRAYNPTTASRYYGPRFDHALTYAPNNFLIQSNNFSDAAWNKDTGGSITATGVSDPFGGTTASTFTAGSNGSRLYQGVGGTSDNINSLWIRRRTGTGAVTLWQNGGNVDVTSSVSGTWARVALKTTIGGYGNYCLLTLGTSGDAIDICDAQTEAVTYETLPRAYNPTTSSAYGVPLTTVWVATGLMDEEQRTNYLKASNFGTGDWVQSGSIGSPVAAAAISPDGTTNMWKLTENSTGAATYELYQFMVTSVSGDHTFSVHLKAAERSFAALKLNINNVDHTAYFNLSTGAVGNLVNASGSCTAGIKNIGNGIYRCSITVPNALSGQDTYCSIFISNANYATQTPNYTGTIGSGIYVYGAQTEAVSFPSSYIPTTTAAVTRSADILQLTGAALAAVQGAAFSIIVEAKGLSSAESYSYLLAAETGAAFIGQNGNSLTDVYTDDVAGGIVASLGSGTMAGVFRAGASQDASNFSLVANGGTVATGTPLGRYPVGVGTKLNGSDSINASVTQLAIYSSRLPNTDLQAKSVVGAAF